MKQQAMIAFFLLVILIAILVIGIVMLVKEEDDCETGGGGGSGGSGGGVAAPPAVAAATGDTKSLKKQQPEAAADPVLEIWGAIGQSNMAGTNAPTADEYRAWDYTDHPSVYQLGRGDGYGSGYKNQILPFKNPPDNFLSMPKSVSMLGYFAQERLKLLPANSKILFVPGAFSGSGYVHQKTWNNATYTWDSTFQPQIKWDSQGKAVKDLNLCFDFVERMKVARQLWPTATVMGVLHHQGETDVNNLEYERQLIAMIRHVRQALALPHLKFILGTLLKSWRESIPAGTARDSTTERINQILWNLAERMDRDENVTTVNLDDIGVVDNNVDSMGVHFNATSQRLMGPRYHQGLLMLQARERNKLANDNNH